MPTSCSWPVGDEEAFCVITSAAVRLQAGSRWAPAGYLPLVPPAGALCTPWRPRMTSLNPRRNRNDVPLKVCVMDEPNRQAKGLRVRPVYSRACPRVSRPCRLYAARSGMRLWPRANAGGATEASVGRNIGYWPLSGAAGPF